MNQPSSEAHAQTPCGALVDLVEPVVAAFADQHRTVLSAPEGARERCYEVSEEFADRCREAGLSAEVISGAEFGELPQFPGVRLLFNGHFATVVSSGTEAVVFDWTMRQFDPTIPVPWICTYSEWRDRWQPMESWASAAREPEA